MNNPDSDFGGSTSSREGQVISMAARGLTDKEISVRLGISHDTVSTYWRRILSRYHASSRTEVIAIVVRSEADLAIATMADEVRTLREQVEAQKHFMAEFTQREDLAEPGHLFLDNLGRVISFNSSFRAVFNFNRALSEGDAIANRLDEMVSEFTDPETAKSHLSKMLIGGQRLPQLDVETKSGERFMIERKATPTREWVGEIWTISPVSGGNAKVPGFQDLRITAEVAPMFIEAPDVTAANIAVNEALEWIGKHFGADRAYVFFADPGGNAVTNTHEWCQPGISSERENLVSVPMSSINWWMNEILSKGLVYVADVQNLPADASDVRKMLNDQGIRSLVSAGLWQNREAREGFIGFIGMDSVRTNSTWDGYSIRLLTHFACLVEALSKRVSLH